MSRVICSCPERFAFVARNVSQIAPQLCYYTQNALGSALVTARHSFSSSASTTPPTPLHPIDQSAVRVGSALVNSRHSFSSPASRNIHSSPPHCPLNVAGKMTSHGSMSRGLQTNSVFPLDLAGKLRGKLPR